MTSFPRIVPDNVFQIVFTCAVLNNLKIQFNCVTDELYLVKCAAPNLFRESGIPLVVARTIYRSI